MKRKNANLLLYAAVYIHIYFTFIRKDKKINQCQTANDVASLILV